ncbi:MAG: nucleoside phosphorylase [Firmicutes bacterium]|jgi:uridine phosphorylase|nr:nucleoside phosphorylase [Bacillota bacterium]MDH7496226.1 nucleoside phosphorylase [Bacillota bacterium]
MEVQHHIRCKPGDIGRTVLLPGDPARAKVIAGYLEDARHVAANREFYTYTGRVDGVTVSTISTGVGAPSASIAVEEAINVGARNLIRVGTCGALQADIAPGQLIIATGAVRGEGTTPEYVPLSYPAVADFTLLRALVDAAEELGIDYRLGIVRTHDAFYIESPFAHGDYRHRIKVWSDSRVLAVENEASAVFVVSSLRGSAGAALLVPAGNLITGHEIKSPSEIENGIDAMIRVALRAAVRLG